MLHLGSGSVQQNLCTSSHGNSNTTPGCYYLLKGVDTRFANKLRPNKRKSQNTKPQTGWRRRACLSGDVTAEVAETEFTVPSETLTSFPVVDLLGYAKTHWSSAQEDTNSDERHYPQWPTSYVNLEHQLPRLQPAGVSITHLWLDFHVTEAGATQLKPSQGCFRCQYTF